jgi:hypothetical protein
MKKHKLAITMGDPSGIGAEIVVKALGMRTSTRSAFLLLSVIWPRWKTQWPLPLLPPNTCHEEPEQAQGTFGTSISSTLAI